VVGAHDEYPPRNPLGAPAASPADHRQLPDAQAHTFFFHGASFLPAFPSLTVIFRNLCKYGRGFTSWSTKYAMGGGAKWCNDHLGLPKSFPFNNLRINTENCGENLSIG